MTELAARRAPIIALLFSIVVAIAAATVIAGVSPAEGAVIVGPEGRLARGDQPATRIKDVARLLGVRDNQLIGMGLVVGLDGTGDGGGAQANVQMVANMLARFGVTVDASTLRLRNVAAVIVTAELPPFHRPGDTIDVVVSSFGDARSLEGGFLLQTPLRAANNEVYAVAQGPVSIGGFNVRGGSSQVYRNHAVVGRIPGGAIVEREVAVQFARDGWLRWQLHRPDFTTAARMAAAINEAFGPGTAAAEDGGSVVVRIPPAYEHRHVAFVSEVEHLAITPDAPARVVINERTGTVVMGHQVRIATVAIAHGNLTVRIASEVDVLLPPPPRRGEEPREPIVIERETIHVEETGRVATLQGGATVGEVVNALNALGVSPRDMIAIFQAIKAAGALYAELEII